MVRGTSTIYIIVGHPIAQVKSPEIFNRWFKKNHVDAVMIPLDIRPESFPAFVECFRRADNVGGVVVTIPFKKTAVAFIDRPSPRVKALGAANTLRVNGEGAIEGDMTDGRGFLRALSQKKNSVNGKHVFIIGCGGAGSAVAWDVLADGAGLLSLMDLDTQRAQRLSGKLIESFPGKDIRVVSRPPSDFHVVFNATPMGMKPEDPLPMETKEIPKGTVVADAVTSPAVTPFLEGARARGHIIQTGAEMAAGQAPVIAEFFGIRGFDLDS